jgi:hypothetical protein
LQTIFASFVRFQSLDWCHAFDLAMEPLNKRFGARVIEVDAVFLILAEDFEWHMRSAGTRLIIR